MPLLKCSKCHHEWESVRREGWCDWCGAPSGRVLAEKTSFECWLDSEMERASQTATVSSDPDAKYRLF